jgi:putative salt-induced outer membrane protein
MNRKLAIATLCYLPFAAFCEEAATTEESVITSSAELGFLYKTGNTKSADIKAGFDLNYESGLWRSLLNIDLLAKKTESDDVNSSGDKTGDTSFDTSDQKWTIESKTNYTIDTESQNYAYGNVAYTDDRFSSFENQSSLSAGWGRHWYKTKVASFFADIGPGLKRDVIKATDTQASTTENAFIVQAQALYLRQINEHVEFKQTLSAKYAPTSGANSIYKAESSISTKLIDTLQLKFSFLIEHNTEVDDDKENTDTQTAMTLVYSF